jgi:molecular chaperone HscB
MTRTWRPRAPENYFELFDLPVAFALDARRLAERYRDLQAATRPERFGTSADAARPAPLQAVNQVNEAYRTLKDPQERARYLLALHTGEAGTDNASSTDGSSLLEQIELRETLSEAQSSPNPGAALATIMTQLAERSLALDKELESLFADPSAENLEAAREILRKLQFLDLCRRDAEALEARLQARP